MVVDRHSHLHCNQEGHHFIIQCIPYLPSYMSKKFTSGFIGHQILIFERSLSLSRGLKAVLSLLAKFFLDALFLEPLSISFSSTVRANSLFS